MRTKTTPHLGIEKMPDDCCMADCINSSSKRIFWGFFQGTKTCTRWNNAVRRQNWLPKQYSKTCSDYLLCYKTQWEVISSYYPRTAHDFD